jgi:hypothetical protein
MQTFLLSKWVIDDIDKIRRRFLCHGHKLELPDKKLMCLVNWTVITMSKIIGGLGVKDLYIMNQSLNVKWMWQWMTTKKWWKEATPVCSQTDKPWELQDASNF